MAALLTTAGLTLLSCTASSVDSSPPAKNQEAPEQEIPETEETSEARHRVLLDTAPGEGFCGEWEEVGPEDWDKEPVVGVMEALGMSCPVGVKTRCIDDVNGDGAQDLLVRVESGIERFPGICNNYGEPGFEWQFDQAAASVIVAGGAIYPPSDDPFLENEFRSEVAPTQSSRFSLVAIPLLEDGRRAFVVSAEYFHPLEGTPCDARLLVVVEDDEFVALIEETACE